MKIVAENETVQVAQVDNPTPRFIVHSRVTLDPRAELACRLLCAWGRPPATDDMGLESACADAYHMADLLYRDFKDMGWSLSLPAFDDGLQIPPVNKAE